MILCIIIIHNISKIKLLKYIKKITNIYVYMYCKDIYQYICTVVHHYKTYKNIYLFFFNFS